MLRNQPTAPVFTPMPTQKCYSFVKTCNEIERFFGENLEDWPAPLREFKIAERDLGFTAFGMTIAFLTDALVDEKILKPGNYREFNPQSSLELSGLDTMILDAQALQHLEIIESAQRTEKGTLFEYVDHCKTPFGKR